MIAVGDITRQIETLVETNRALLEDVSEARRSEAALAHRRDALRSELAELAGPTPARAHADAEQARRSLASVRRSARQLQQEREQVSREEAMIREQLDPIEEHMAALTRALSELERERTELVREVDATASAMVEIRCCLESHLELGGHHASAR